MDEFVDDKSGIVDWCRFLVNWWVSNNNSKEVGRRLVKGEPQGDLALTFSKIFQAIFKPSCIHLRTIF